MSPDPQHSYTDCASSLPKSVYNLVSITFQCIAKAHFTSDLKLCSGTCQEIDVHFHDCDVRAKEWITKLMCHLLCPLIFFSIGFFVAALRSTEGYLCTQFLSIL